jgi:hypothetical protein
MTLTTAPSTPLARFGIAIGLACRARPLRPRQRSRPPGGTYSLISVLFASQPTSAEDWIFSGLS